MNQQPHASRRRARLYDWLATLVVAGVLALMAVLLGEGLIRLAGVALADPAWHRDWVDGRLTTNLTPLAGLLGIALFAVLLIPAYRIGPALIARYDDATLSVQPTRDSGTPSTDSPNPARMAIQQALTAWCFAGAGTGTSPFWRPWTMPQVDQRLAVAVLTDANSLGNLQQPITQLAEALSRELDGTPLLAACANRQARLRLRLRVKLNDILWWRPRHRDDPWDSGYLNADPALPSRLEQFQPRRATLIVADELPAAMLTEAIAVLHAHRAEYRHPIRLLITTTNQPASPGLHREAARSEWVGDLQGLGTVPVFDLSDTNHSTPTLRA